MNTNNHLRFVETQTISIPQRKKNLRAFMKERRGQNENRDMKELHLLQQFKNAFLNKTGGVGTKRTYFVYLSFSSEAPTDGLIQLLMEEGNEVYCPRIENGEMKAVKYGDDFTLSSYGIREPIGEVYEGDIDVLIIPLLAVDEQGNRLGYGGGFYDRFIEKMPKAKRIGYCYDFQILKEVPVEKTDKKLQSVVTDKRVLFFE